MSQNQNLSDIYAKQKHLRDNIEQDDYEKFVQFCSNKKGNLKIELWSFQEIQQLISQFYIENLKVKKSLNQFNQQNNSYFFSQKLQNNNKQSNQLLETISQQKSQINSPKLLLKKQQNEQITSSFSALALIDLLEIQPISQFTNKKFSPEKLNQYLTNTKIKQSPKLNKNKTNNDNNNFNKVQVKINHNNQPQIVQNKIQEITLLEKTFKQEKLHKIQQTKIIKIQPIQQQFRPNNNRPNNNRLSTPLQIYKYPQNSHVIKRVKSTSQNSNLNSSISIPKSSIINNSNLLIPKIYKEQFQQTIKCRQQQKINSQIPFQNIKQISIKKHQIIHRTFFLPDYVMYHVELKPLNLICKRNYQDFTKLKDNLIKYYPGIKVPFLQNNSWLSQTNIEFIKKQKVSLQYFLTQLLQHKILRKSSILINFLTMPDHKSIKRKFQRYDLQTIPRSIDQLKNQNGSINIKLSNSDHYFIQKSSQFLKQIQTFFNQYNSIMLNVISNYESLIGNFRIMSKIINNIKNKTQRFQQLNQKLMNRNEYQIKIFPETLKNCEQICQMQLINLTNKKQFIFERIYPFMKYQQANLSSIESILTKRKQIQQKYLSQVQLQSISPSTSSVQKKRTIKKDYFSPELKQFKTNILQFSQNSQISKYNLAYLNSKLKKQYLDMFQNLGIGMDKEYLSNLQQYLQEEKKFTINKIQNLLKKKNQDNEKHNIINLIK